MAYRTKKQKHESGVTLSEMNGLAELLLEAFKASIEAELRETGQVNPRLLAEAVRWLNQSGVTLANETVATADFSALVKALSFEDAVTY